MDPITSPYIVPLVTNITTKITGVANRKLRTTLYGTEGRQALARSIRAGIVALLAQVHDDTIPILKDRVEGIFTNFFNEPDTITGLSPLLYGNPVNRKELAEIFAEQGYDADTLPGIDFKTAITHFEAAFIAAAMREPLLQGTIQSGLLLTQSRIQSNLLATMQELVQFLRQAKPSSIQIKNKQVTAQDMNARQIDYQTSTQASKGTCTTIIGDGNVTGSGSNAEVIKQKAGKNATQIGKIGEVAPQTSTAKNSKTNQAELDGHQELEIKGHGNVIGHGSRSQVTKQEAGDSSFQIGQMSATAFSLADLLRLRGVDLKE